MTDDDKPTGTGALGLVIADTPTATMHVRDEPSAVMALGGDHD